MYKLCKTEQSAVRQRQLEQKLADLMNIHRYEEITVSDFCTYAGIPRKAFYRYFSSKDGALYALLDHTMQEYELLREPQSASGLQDIQMEMEHFFRFWHQQKPLLDALELSGISGILMERAIDNVMLFTKDVITRDNPKMRDHVLRFAVCGLMIMMIDWHHRSYQESISEMSAIALRLLSQPLFSV
ncbi:MAG: TetR/AcrR family transcriptional regulator [Oscillospiraceae bacterium]|nr:TetR/AcrR family transcriptional regulator [Oscillospiraceae bacterium]